MAKHKLANPTDDGNGNGKPKTAPTTTGSGEIVVKGPIAEFPERLRFLFQPARYKVAYGGRGGTKSWGFARALLIMAAERPLRILCARETMQSIADSVHTLLTDQIAQLHLDGYYTIQKSAILGRNGSQFAFCGLRHNVSHIKSYESFDVAWVEEAQSVSKASWEVLIPTIRTEGSEIWVSFNPELDTDDTYRRFVINPPPGAVVQRMTWRDNPWLTDVLRAEMEHLRETDEAAYNHVWEGMCVSIVEGAIYAAELAAADREQRITRVPYDQGRPVHTFWDLGIGDSTAIWCVQAFPFEFRLIDYLEGSSRSLKTYVKQLQERPYVYGTHYLPHDARARELGSGRSIEEQLRGMGFTVQVVPRLSVVDGINAARTIFPQCWFDAEKCADGLQGLRHYRWGPEGVLGQQRREPLHDFASHPADAFRYFAVGIRVPRRPKPKVDQPKPVITAWS